MKKKLLIGVIIAVAVILALVLVLTLPKDDTTDDGTPDNTTDNNSLFTFGECNDENGNIIGYYVMFNKNYNGTPVTELEFPSTHNDKPVIEIRGRSLSQGETYWNASVTSVIIPDSVTKIGKYAFDNYTSLIKIEIPSSVTSIGEWAFSYSTLPKDIYYAGNVEGWLNIDFDGDLSNPMEWNGSKLYFDGQLVTNIEIPSSVTNIPTKAFINCASLESITIPGTVTKIGWYAFENCSSLTTVVLPNSVTEIGSSAFVNCTSLESVTIPSSVTSMGQDAFYKCSNIKTITFEGTRKQWTALVVYKNWGPVGISFKIICSDEIIYIG